jgi:hypothetical protein
MARLTDPVNTAGPWKASYFWMRDQRDAARAEVRRLRAMLEPTYVNGDLVDGSDR